MNEFFFISQFRQQNKLNQHQFFFLIFISNSKIFFYSIRLSKNFTFPHLPKFVIFARVCFLSVFFLSFLPCPCLLIDLAEQQKVYAQIAYHSNNRIVVFSLLFTRTEIFFTSFFLFFSLFSLFHSFGFFVCFCFFSYT